MAKICLKSATGNGRINLVKKGQVLAQSRDRSAITLGAVPSKNDWCLYVLECKNKALYTGISNNVFRRIFQHKRGKGARYTKNFGVKRLVYLLYGFSRPDAMRAERFLKKLPPNKKRAFIRIKPKKKLR